MERQQKPIQLDFNCREDLSSMPCTSKGKFCGSCQKEVIDFTSMTYSEIQRSKGSEAEVCGMFLPEQLDPSLRPIEFPKFRSWAFMSTILVSINLGSATAQSTIDPKVEQSQGTSNAPKITQQEAEEKMASGEHISMSKAAAPETDEFPAEVKKEKAKRRKKLYWSKRFPFIHRVNRRYAGAYAYGWDYNSSSN